jgi:hypothetical protein
MTSSIKAILRRAGEIAAVIEGNSPLNRTSGALNRKPVSLIISEEKTLLYPRTSIFIHLMR